MQCIHVYDLLDQPEQIVRASEIQRVLKIGVHENQLKMWCIVNENSDTAPLDYQIFCKMTGESFDGRRLLALKGFIGSVIMPDNRVLHFWIVEHAGSKIHDRTPEFMG